MNHRFLLILSALFWMLHMTCGHAHAAAATQPIALLVRQLFPPAGAGNVCTDTPLRITFNHPPAVGVGQVRVMDAADHSLVQAVDVGAKTAEQSIGGVPHFKYYPVIVSGNDATIYLPNGSLSNGKSYYISLDAGAFKDESGDFAGLNAQTNWQFTTKSAPPKKGTDRLVIAADGSGDFCTLQAAIDWVPGDNSNRITLFLRNGIYTELIRFHQKHALTITGEDRKQTIIAYSSNAIFNPSSEQGYHRGVFMASACQDLVLSNLTLRNTTPRGGSQAEAIILNGTTTSKTIIANVDLYSTQDTLQINGQAYLTHCYIEGDVDFMWGKGPCFFESCHCFGTRSKGYFAQIRNPESNHGYVYHRCIFDGPPGVTGMYFNRIAPATYPNSEMVLIDCQVDQAISPLGWLLNTPPRSTTVPTTIPNLADLHFFESNSHDANGNPIDITHRLPASRQLKSPQDTQLIINYTQPSFVLGHDWQAESDPNLPAAPK